jgi:hypothetical protein
MGTRVTATFKVSKWDEHPYLELDGGRKFTRASVRHTYAGGALEGESTSESLMFYREDGTATYTGFEHIVGRLNGRTGSFVLQGSGSYENGVAKTTYVIVSGSGTGELRGIRGQALFEAGHGEQYPLTIDYEITD